MCGISGGYYVNQLPPREVLLTSLSRLSSRGPDNEGIMTSGQVFLGHRRLSIIDVSANSNQPMSSDDGRYTIIFNGEIYNFRDIKARLTDSGHSFRTTGDTEVLLQAYMAYGEDCLEMLNGFFAFAIYDRKEGSIFAARDRMGIKPLYYYRDAEKILFSSEMKALYPLNIKREIDFNTLAQYLQLNYIPAPYSIYRSVRKLLPGQCMTIRDGEVRLRQYYQVPYKRGEYTSMSYDEAKTELIRLVDDSVSQRLVSDVPLGTFLSGGIDSTVVTSVAARHKSNLNTFSIGFRDEGFFDETAYAEKVAEKLKTNHSVFKLTNDDLLDSLNSLLEYIDEPFADSSALLVNLLSRYTRQHVTVALSGDGGDELFAGYNKHYGEWRIRNKGIAEFGVNMLTPLWKSLPKGRHGKWNNRIRQLERFADGMKLPPDERYWRWCSFIPSSGYKDYFLWNIPVVEAEMVMRRKRFTSLIKPDGDLNDDLYADVQLVLPNDMLTKVDLMSMANSLEVRVPLLDHRIVEFAFSLPVSYKIDRKMKKKILQDAFRDVLPDDIYNRPKKGFEVPLLQWFRKELKSLIEDDLLSDDFIRDQQIFDLSYIKQLRKRLFSSNPGDVHAQIWALIVFQSWYRNYHSR